jgi:hypoxanthine phosphoribosyltransferase
MALVMDARGCGGWVDAGGCIILSQRGGHVKTRVGVRVKADGGVVARLTAMHALQQDVASVLFDRKAIARRVEAVAARMARDWHGFADDRGRPAEITLVPILTGSLIFVADLIRCLPLRMQIRLLSISSYPGDSTTSRGPRVQAELSNLPPRLDGAHVLLVDDILDSGRTLTMAVDLLRQRGPASLRTCVLLRKDRPTARAVAVDYVCFDVVIC